MDFLIKIKVDLECSKSRISRSRSQLLIWGGGSCLTPSLLLGIATL